MFLNSLLSPRRPDSSLCVSRHLDAVKVAVKLQQDLAFRMLECGRSDLLREASDLLGTDGVDTKNEQVRRAGPGGWSGQGKVGRAGQGGGGETQWGRHVSAPHHLSKKKKQRRRCGVTVRTDWLPLQRSYAGLASGHTPNELD